MCIALENPAAGVRRQHSHETLHAMNHAESAAHKELKRLALIWAQMNGYRVAAGEVSLPNYRFRLDVAGYRPGRVRVSIPHPELKTKRVAWQQMLGVTAVFECKASKPDFRRDARSLAATLEQLKTLREQKTRIEQELRLFYPSIRNGDSLFQEFETVNFERPGHERYQHTLDQIRRLTSRLYANTKFDKLVKWGAANLFYVVAEPDTVLPHELPACWGLLVRNGSALTLAVKPILHEVGEPERLSLLHRISFAATRAVNREHGVTSADLGWEDTPRSMNQRGERAPAAATSE